MSSSTGSITPLTNEALADLMPDLTSTVVTAIRPKDRERAGEISERFARYAEATGGRRATSLQAGGRAEERGTQEPAPGDDLFDDRVLAASDDISTQRLERRR
jgi:hypothetical protein